MQGVEADVLINATPIGMSGGVDADTLAFSEDEIDRAKVILMLLLCHQKRR